MTVYNIDWLLESEFPWVTYMTRLDLLGEKKEKLKNLKSEIVEHKKVQMLIKDISSWPKPALKNHKDAVHPLHKIVFLTDLGLDYSDKPMRNISEKIMENQSPEGPFELTLNISKTFGGSGDDEISWMACDSVVSLYILLKLGLEQNPKVKKALDYMVSLVRENGWPCKGSESLGGKFKGPGRRTDPCPYVNFYMVKVLSQSEEYKDSEQIRIGIDTIFDLWEKRRKEKPYLFGMGSDFIKLKAPFIWYDILHFLDVLVNIPYAVQNKYFRQMIEILELKQDDELKFTPESVYREYKDWDFGQKRKPSEWITFLAYRILKKYYNE